ncbi:hypothetical protein VPHD51_0206 [Vibrio phage D51]
MEFKSYPAALIRAAQIGKPFYTVRINHKKIILVIK